MSKSIFFFRLSESPPQRRRPRIHEEALQPAAPHQRRRRRIQTAALRFRSRMSFRQRRLRLHEPAVQLAAAVLRHSFPLLLSCQTSNLGIFILWTKKLINAQFVQ